ncbi:MAG: MFS transporter [Dorea sp.]
MKETGKEYRLGVKEKVCYSFGDCAGQIYVTLASFFLTGYYTDTVGISALAVGTMMLVARIFDGTTDLAMGAIIDKTKSKYGKARAWILWTAPLMALALIALFSVPSSLSEGGKLVYAYITYILLNCIIYTANGIAYNSLLARMTYNVQDRCSASSLRFVLGNIMALLINGVTATLVTSIGWQRLIIIYAIIELLLLLICFAECKEHIGETEMEEDEVKTEKVPLKIAIPALLKNKYFFMQALMLVFLYINIMSVGSMTYYFCNTVLGSLAIMTVVTMAYNIPTILGSFVNPGLVAKMGKRKVLIICFILSIIGRCLVGLAGTSIPVALVGVAIHGLALGPIYSNVFAMTPDIVDYGEWKTGIRSEGLVTCCVSFGMKVGIGVGGALATWVLTFGGYEGTAAVQTAAAHTAIRFGFGYLSAILSVICLVIAIVMNLDKDIMKIQNDLMAKHGNK